MRASLIATVAATVTMVLLAMLVPMAVLVRSYALEEQLLQASLEVQATETVVSGQDKGAVATYLDRLNRAGETRTTVLYPDGDGVGPDPGEDPRVAQARRTGQARVDDVAGGAEILVPVSLGGSSTLPSQTPVIRVHVPEPGFGSGVLRAWVALSVLGLVLLVGAVLLADRLGRSFVEPIRTLAAYARGLGASGRREPVVVSGPTEVQELGTALNRLVHRIEDLLERERQGVTDLSHQLRTPITVLRLRLDAIRADERHAGLADELSADVDALEQMVDHVVREARRSEREGLVATADGLAVLRDRALFWGALADEQARPFRVDAPASGPVPVRASEADLVALLDTLLDNVFSHTPEGAPVAVTVLPSAGGGLTLVIEDGGPGFPADLDVAGRGASGAGSTGLGLSIAERTARESGGGLRLSGSSLGGARVEADLGAAH